MFTNPDSGNPSYRVLGRDKYLIINKLHNMHEGRKMEIQKKKKNGCKLITVAFYYTEIRNLHMKNYITLFKIMISYRQHYLLMLIFKSQTLNYIMHAL